MVLMDLLKPPGREKKMSGSITTRGRFGPLVLLSLFAAAAACGPAAGDASSVEALRRMGKAFTSIADSSLPAVVGVKAESRPVEYSRPGQRQWPFGDPFDRFDDDFFDHFFRRQPRRRQPGRGYHQIAQGSGFIISADGYVLTNNHLVGDADKVMVKLADDRDFEAKVIGTDPQSDVAVIKIDGEAFPSLKLADSARLEVGEWVLAIGNPFGLSQTVTAGIVSAKGRSNVGLADFEDFIQTDAAINPGNSGGPLLNLDGEVVGINTAIVSRSGGNMGIGFAIPINMARNIFEQLIEAGTVERGFLGVVIQDLTGELAKSFGLPEDTRGVLVPEVMEDSAAEEAGLKRNDIIVELNGEPVEKADVLRNSVAMQKPGTEVDVVVLREGRRKTFTVKLGRRPGQAAAVAENELLDKLGFGVQDLTDELAGRLGYGDLTGVVVSSVEMDSPADRAGLSAGTLIMEVNRRPVDGVEQFHDAIGRAAEGGSILLLVRDRNYTRFVVLTVPPAERGRE
jgi:serine protease Do